MTEMIFKKIKDIECMFVSSSEGKIPDKTKEYPFRYAVRHDELDWTKPVSIEIAVWVNRWGYVLAEKKLIEDGEILQIDWEEL